MKVSVDQLIELAREVENEDPIDWGMLAVNEDEAYRLIALNLVEIFENVDNQDLDTVLMSMIVKLTVENFVLNLKLLGKY
jgi:hypothetical protein